MSNRIHRILLVRNVFSNIGDDAMLRCDIQTLLGTFPGCSLTVLTDDPQTVRRKHRVDAEFSEIALSHPFSDKAVQLLRTTIITANERSRLMQSAVNLSSRIITLTFLRVCCKLFVWNARRLRDGKRIVGLFPHQKRLLELLAVSDMAIAGGSLIPSIKSLYMLRTALYRAISILKVPLVLHGQTVLPAPSLASVYKLPTQIILRDHNLSRKNALTLGVDDNSLVTGIDPAFELPVVNDDAVISKLRAIGLDDPLREVFIALNVRAWRGQNFKTSFQTIVRAFERYCFEHPRTSIVLFSMQRYRAQDDAVTLNELRSQFKLFRKVLLLGDISDPRLLKGILSKAHCVITCRYHGAVFALTQLVPAIGLSVSSEYDIKLSGIFDMFGVGRFVLPIRLLDEERLYQMLESITRERQAFVETLKERKETLRSFQSLLGQVCESVLESRLDQPSSRA